MLKDVKMIAISNLVGLIISGTVGIIMALNEFGAWALVWQSIILAVIKTTWLWAVGGWIPHGGFHIESLRQIYKVGMGVFTSSFLNTVFLNIYSFVIGAYYNLAALGNYTQADKWSKMGSASISQILTASFVPVLSQYQDDGERFKSIVKKTNNFTSFILFPFMCGLIVMAEPIFHLLFGNKWDTAIILFQILLMRGIFVVLTSLYNNYLLSLGHAKSLVIVEFVKDGLTLAAILSTIFMQSVEALVWGQLAASAATYIFILFITSRNTGYHKTSFIADMIPYLLTTIVCCIVMWFVGNLVDHNITIIALQSIVGLMLYYIGLRLIKSPILADVERHIVGHFKKAH